MIKRKSINTYKCVHVAAPVMLLPYLLTATEYGSE